MTFSEKLDFLLNLTNTPNNMLAKSLSLDPSYISRLRKGQRSVPHEDYINMIASFFSKRCMEEYILSALGTAMNHSYINSVTGPDELSLLLFEWLTSSNESKTSRLQTLLSDFSNPSSENASRKQAAEREAQKKYNQNLQMFYGMEGRRQATLALFNLALQKTQPGTLLLFSDENSKWMLENSSFSHEWATLLWQIILNGHKVKVIHKVSRDIDEMLDVIHQWLPFYASGSVEPYYYPRLRDGVYKRTLSVVPGVAAVFATSIGESMDTTANFMSTDKLTVDSFTNEFYSYLALCKPLIHIHTYQELAPALKDLYTFQTRPGHLIIDTTTLELITLPKTVIRSLHRRYPEIIPEDLIEANIHWQNLFESKLNTDSVWQIINLASPEDIQHKQKAARISLLNQAGEIYYSKEEYILHLKNILRLLQTYDNFNVILSDNNAKPYSLYCNEDYGVMVLKEGNPPVLFEITEANMTSAFWDYASQLLQHSHFRSQHRTEVMQRINELIKIL